MQGGNPLAQIFSKTFPFYFMIKKVPLVYCSVEFLITVRSMHVVQDSFTKSETAKEAYDRLWSHIMAPVIKKEALRVNQS